MNMLDVLNDCLPYLFQTGHESNLHEQLQMAWPHQWDIVVGIPSPLEMGCGQSSSGEPDCSCAKHRGGSHPMCVGASSFTCVGCAQPSFL